ncbi:MFS siderochrome iron transporter 1 [Fulvia fulva]|uniref:MFS siderochrome iron transporter 1 n=1 Tax=Passalora fulva TaxID=5499 RepID=A0A9Q8PMH3_PASFU|nr:MFS siderochrome iron transporter 1 [Fulvia fulva]UJO25349.1 MFS siderochrome iron transporter 1 [Fulvia fulva]WPV22767.1 MFS siderochrome iron transporter 1 [Fulvia fulva]
MPSEASSRPAQLRLQQFDSDPEYRPLLAPHPRTRGMEKTDSGSEPPRASTSKAPVDLNSIVEEGTTLFERKCLLINAEIDNNGMGRYQWSIWFLCGFGYFLDLLWAQAFGLVLSPLEQELGFAGNQSGNISIAFSAGLTAGAFVWGVLVDIIGRKWAFNITCLIGAAFGLGLGGCNTYSSFLVITAFVGFGIGGNIPIDTTICLEFIPQNKRFMLALLSIFQPIGVVVCCIIAYGFIPTYSCEPNFTQGDRALPSCKNVPSGQACCTRSSNMGWRYLMFTIGGITLAVFFLRFVVFNFKESPKFLVYRGQDAKAVEVLEHIAKTNKRPCGVTLADFEALDQADAMRTDGMRHTEGPSTFNGKFRAEMLRYGSLVQDWRMTRLTILVWLTYAFDYWGFTLAGTYLPSILAIKNGALDLSLRHTYRSYIAIYAPGIVGVVLGAMMYGVPAIGRKWTMVISSALMGISIFLFSTVNSEASNIGLNVMEYFFQSMFNSVLYGWTPEVFAAPIRGTASGVASFWGRLFSILAPLTAQSVIPAGGLSVENGSINEVLYLAGGLTMGAVITTALLPNRLGKQSM